MEFTDSPSRQFFGPLSVFFQFVFFFALSLYWLVEFGHFALQDAEYTRLSWRFYAPRLAVCSVFFLISMGIYIKIKMDLYNNPLHNWYDEFGAMTAVKVLSGIMFICYISWIVVLLYEGMKAVCCASGSSSATLRKAIRDEWRKAWVFSFHLIVLFLGICGVAFGGVVGTEVSTTLNLYFFIVLFNVYVYTLALMYSPGRRTQMNTLEDEEDEEDREEREDRGGLGGFDRGGNGDLGMTVAMDDIELEGRDSQPTGTAMEGFHGQVHDGIVNQAVL